MKKLDNIDMAVQFSILDDDYFYNLFMICDEIKITKDKLRFHIKTIDEKQSILSFIERAKLKEEVRMICFYEDDKKEIHYTGNTNWKDFTFGIDGGIWFSIKLCTDDFHVEGV